MVEKKHSLTDLKLIKRHDLPSPNHNIIYEIPLKRAGYALRLLARRASAGRIGAETLGVCAMRKARRRCMFLTTAVRRSTSSFIASAISASRRSIRDAVLSFGSLFSGSGCFASSIIGRTVCAIPCPIHGYSERRLRMQHPSWFDSGVGFQPFPT